MPRTASRSSRWAPIARGEVAQLVQIARPVHRPDHQRRRRAPRRLRHARGRGARRRRDGRGLPPSATAVINADDAFASLWRASTAARVVTFGLRQRGGLPRRASCASTSAQPASCTRFRAAQRRSGSVPVEPGAGRTPQRRSTRWPPPPRPPAPAPTLAQIAAGLAADARGAGPAAVQTHAPAAPGSSTTPTTPIRARCAPASRCSRHCRDGAGWCSATWRELGEFAADSHREIGEFARALGIERLFATGALAALAAETLRRRAPSGSRDAGGAGARARCRRSAPDVRLLIKGSRVNRLERVVEALLARARRRAGRADRCCTGSHKLLAGCITRASTCSRT